MTRHSTLLDPTKDPSRLYDPDFRQARHAAAGLRRLGFPLLEMAALELAAEPAAALEIYRRCGAAYDVRRLAPEPPATVQSSSADRAPTPAPDRLSTRERAIAVLVARGQSNFEIDSSLSISHKTVEKHLGAVYKKVGIASRAELSVYATLSESAERNNRPEYR